jgi:energy-coupling factor transporter ATP-binding protein EcfA2
MTNAIIRVEIEDFLVFKGKLEVEFCPGVNVIIGSNGTGKTTLLQCLYEIQDEVEEIANDCGGAIEEMHREYISALAEGANVSSEQDVMFELKWGKVCLTVDVMDLDIVSNLHLVYIPEKDILEHAKGLLTFIEQKQTGFGRIYKDVLVSAQDIPTQRQSETQVSVGEKIAKQIGGIVRWDKGEGSFYTLRTDGIRIPFSNEASGYKKLGFLGLLVTSGQLEKGSILFWDEPENSLNPELVPVFVDILLELSRNGVQIFIATHNYDVARWFELSKRPENELRYFNLRKDGDGIVADVASDYISLDNNPIDAADDKLLKRVVEISAEKAGVKRK